MQSQTQLAKVPALPFTEDAAMGGVQTPRNGHLDVDNGKGRLKDKLHATTSWRRVLESMLATVTRPSTTVCITAHKVTMNLLQTTPMQPYRTKHHRRSGQEGLQENEENEENGHRSNTKTYGNGTRDTQRSSSTGLLCLCCALCKT